MASADVEFRCFVGGLAWATTDSSLHEAFSAYGDILESKIINDRETGRSRGFGFVTFRDEKSMRDAIEGMNGQNLDGRLTLSSLQTNLQAQISTCCKQISPSLILFHQIQSSNPARLRKLPSSSSNGGVLSVKAYIENQNSISNFANKVIGSLPVIGLFARILSDEGGVGGDIIDFAEFRRRVGNKCSINDSKAFYDFQERRGRAGDPLYVLICCWLAAVGAGLLKSEEILEGAARLRVSNDVEFEEETFLAAKNEAKERRAKLNAVTPTIPMAIRAEKALEAIYVCCFGKELVEEEDERLLVTILRAVFPTVEQPEIERIVKEKARKVAEGSDETNVPESKPLPKEAVKQQMKDLEFLKQNSET